MCKNQAPNPPPLLGPMRWCHFIAAYPNDTERLLEKMQNDLRKTAKKKKRKEEPAQDYRQTPARLG